MKPSRLLSIAFAVLTLAGASSVQALPVIPGSTAFCLYEVPVDEEGMRRWINLGIVQYVEASSTELTIFYGGGAFGAGHEARYTVTDPKEARLILEKMRAVAAACR